MGKPILLQVVKKYLQKLRKIIVIVIVIIVIANTKSAKMSHKGNGRYDQQNAFLLTQIELENG